MARTLQSSEEQQRLLSLAQAETAGASIGQEDSVLSADIGWHKYEQSHLLKPGSASVLQMLHNMPSEERANHILTHSEVPPVVFSVLNLMDLQAIQYIITLIMEVVRDDGSRYDVLMGCLPDADIFTPFHKTLSRQDVDTATSDKAAYLLSGFMCRGGSKKFSESQVTTFVTSIVNASYTMTELGKLESFCNLLKNNAYRNTVFEARGVTDMILKNVDPERPAPNLYKACFCVWLSSFRPDLLKQLIDRGVVLALRKVLGDSRVEKVVRVCIHTLPALLEEDKAVEDLLERNTLQVLQLLEYEKWRDAELYEEIRQTLYTLQSKVKQYSNFERYEKELANGKLRWSHLHQEKFFHENIEKFGEDDFRVSHETRGREGDLHTQQNTPPPPLSVPSGGR